MPVRKVSKVISIKENPVGTAAPAETSCESTAESVGMVPQHGLGGCPAADVHPVPSAPVRSGPPATPLFPVLMGVFSYWGNFNCFISPQQ